MTTLSAVIYPEADQWVAQCVELDIGAQARTMEEALERFDAAIIANLNESLRHGSVPFAGIEAAPAHFQDMLNRCADKPPVGSINRDNYSVAMRLCEAA